jgi:uncharacterized protein with HEPN domain
MARKTPRLYLEHIRDAIAIIERRVAGKTLDDLVADDVLRDALERRIEIISEASRRLPEDMKARHPEVPWHNVAGIGNILRHEYYSVNLDIIWRIATQDLRPLAAAVDALLAEVLRDWRK